MIKELSRIMEAIDACKKSEEKKTALLLVKDSTRIAELDKKIDERAEYTNATICKIKEECIKTVKELWQQIEEELTILGKIKEKEDIHLKIEDGVVYRVDRA